MIKNWNKISALLNYHGYQNLNRNLKGAFCKFNIKTAFISNKNLKALFSQKKFKPPH